MIRFIFHTDGMGFLDNPLYRSWLRICAFQANKNRQIHLNCHAGATPAQIGMKKGYHFWYYLLERGTLQSTLRGVARNSSAVKAAS